MIALCSALTNLLAQDYNLGLPFVRYYSTREYGGGIQNWSIAQNKYGLIYVANNFGVLEFDGSSWKIHTPLTGTKVRHVYIDTDGKIYVASQGDFGYLFPDDRGKLVYTSLADSLPQQYRNFDETWRIFKDGNRLLFCTFRQIFIYNPSGEIEVVEPKYAPENFFYSNHQLYVNQLEEGLTYLSGTELKKISNSSFLKGKTVTGVINLPNNELWISTLHHGVYVYNGTDFRVWSESNHDTFVRSSINCALRLRNGNYAIGTQSNGVFILSSDGDILLHLNKTKGLNNRTVLCLFEDAQNNLWLGHNNGLSFVELGMPFTYINEQVGLPGTGYDGFLDHGRLYLGTNNGLYFKDIANRSLQDFQFVKNTEGQVYTINKVKNHLLLGHHNGAFQLNRNEAHQFSDILGAWTFLRLKDRPEYIIEGTYKGLLLHKEINGKMVFQHKIKGFSESSRVMEQGEDGHIWMTHGYKGIYRLELNKDLDSVSSVRYYGQDSGLPSNLLINVFRIRNRLIFTTQNKIYRYDKRADKFVLDEFFKNFFDNDPVIAMAEDPFQNIYYITLNDIGVLQKNASGEFQKRSSIFNKLKDMLNDDLQNVSILSANQVLYGAKEGFILYQADKADIEEIPFHTLIREVSIKGDSAIQLFNGFYVENQQISSEQPRSYIKEIPYHRNSIQFSFSAAFIDGFEKTEYQYWLENSEKGWSEWSPKTDKEYTNLSEGKYIFHVRAKNIYDKISEQASYEFIVLAPWYRTNMAYTAYGSMVFISLFISFYLFDKKHKKERRLLTIKQKRELNAKEYEIESITRKSEEEIQRLKNEKLQNEIENKNKQLATSTMHLINKNGFISSIKGNLGSISKRSKNQEVKKELKRIISTIDKNISQDDDWEHFTFHFDQVHGDFTNRFKEEYPDLSPQEMKLSAYLRMNLSTKEIAHLLNISVRGVEIARYRLRKKLGLERSTNLQEYILKF